MNTRSEAYKIILKVLQKGIYSGKLLEQSIRKTDFESLDKALLYQLVKGVIKLQNNLDYISARFINPEKFRNTPLKLKILLYLGIYQLVYCDSIPEHAALNETVELGKKLFGDKVAGFVNAVLRAVQKNDQIIYPEDTPLRLSVRYSFPIDLIKIWLSLWGDENTEKLCRYFNQTPLLSIRINRYATDREKLLKYFLRRGVELDSVKASPNMLITSQTTEVLEDVAFSEGYFSVQDISAALVVELMDPKLDQSILDLFAGPGGKATYASEIMQNTGELVAVDKFPLKVKKIKHNVERLQISNMKIINEDAFNYGPVAPAFDRVLLDVPCTGWGVFQKKAELRWQFNQDLKSLLLLQENALKKGALFVREGGFLVYSTCTLNPDENEHQVEKFLEKNRNFKLVPASESIPVKYTNKDYMITLPFKHNMDGAFAAKMQKLS
ncbi:MAG: 16S rRNA (cytosine(967)-C(5))-methyltransferase RsmB [Candidatus Cloacimonetes bacterium]|nr:16S rRNA (cytosine(967)-C(5))-methyltransferase RsmB [Candidatus Cloacimonadota bacterium]